MSAPSAEQEDQPTTTGAWTRLQVEQRLTQLQTEDYVMPGWQVDWSEADQCVKVMFQPCHQGTTEAVTAAEFCMWVRGWEARKAAVMARRPRPERKQARAQRV